VKLFLFPEGADKKTGWARGIPGQIVTWLWPLARDLLARSVSLSSRLSHLFF
jgi:hypothetical protein